MRWGFSERREAGWGRDEIVEFGKSTVSKLVSRMREDWSMETTVLLISLAIIPVLIALILLCLKIKTSKSNPDLFGTVGTVTSKEDCDAYLPASLNVSAESGGGEVRTPSYDRKLPELPSSEDQQFSKGKEGDSNSDLYATVDEMPNNNNCMVAGPAISLVPDSSHHPYAQVLYFFSLSIIRPSIGCFY